MPETRRRDMAITSPLSRSTGNRGQNPSAEAETCDVLEVRHQAPRQPPQLDVALALFLKMPARLDAIEATAEIGLQKNDGVVG
jgi:hypothetical protein